MAGKVIIVGAGPGDPELITLKGKKAIEEADIIVYAGSLVNKEILKYNRKNAKIYNSATMDLEEIVKVMVDGVEKGLKVVRLHTGDPSIYGAIKEQIDELKKHNIEVEIIPGVTSLSAAASSLKVELTLPKVSQTVIITRPEGRTPKPEGESLKELARHRSTMAIFLGVGMIDKVVSELIEGGYRKDTPVAVVYKASWKDEKVVKGTLEDIALKVKEANIRKTALIIVGDVLCPKEYEYSKLYNKNFETEYRRKKV
ncbi:precorrin-4 C(11)-methyltransferase [Methanofervidicoccus abyssi]|uniref:Precorrin-4/cobalt-precorrin-4 C11-methyltransferase n=1 Tax=Methanofervidicoccus abyssi TaxID=2082189 RepID=A0A401HQP9_9EURY|nr:precorrin-4 C(11)-methyltransferase [Methanofervidicoccus abyssi]GBF36481.1 precorrin-4/cobalt-precorrin-4 C11-methyltransferase [Methanofervidicoccus abyssi]